MRLAACALSAVLLSGCSWLGVGGHGQDSYDYGYATYGAGCAPVQTASYANQAYGFSGAGTECAPKAGYSAMHQGYAQQGYAQHGYGQAQVPGLRGSSGHYMQGYEAYGAGAGTTLGAAAPYGAAVGGAGYAQSGYAASGYSAAGGGNVQTVMGEPIYVPQPYAQAYGVSGEHCCGGGAGMPFGLELSGGADFALDGDIFPGKPASPNQPDFATATGEVVANSVSYGDAFGEGYGIGGTLGYDISPNTTLLGTVGYQKNKGQSVAASTFEPGFYDAAGNFTSTGPVETVTGEFSDLEQFTIEGGVRQYVGYNPTFRPYVGASAGFTHNNNVSLTQSSTSLGAFSQPYIDSAWKPTAAGVLGAEMAVSPRAAIGVETGIRWRDDLDTNVKSDDRWSIPLTLRGRVAF